LQPQPKALARRPEGPVASTIANGKNGLWAKEASEVALRFDILVMIHHYMSDIFLGARQMTMLAISPRTCILAVVCALALLTCQNAPLRAAPNVIVTIKPIHSLAAAILHPLAQPKLLIEGAASPHTYALKPSDAEALSNADAIVRVSENLEVFLEKAIKTLPPKARIIDLDKAPGLILLPVRDGGPLAGHDQGEVEEGHRQGHETIDVHFWLDPANAIAIAEELARQFSEIDAEHTAQYQANAKRLKANLLSLDEELRTRLAGLSNKPFMVFHDVTQYFEKRYDLHGLGAITLGPERAPGAKRLAAIRAKIKETQAICVFSEPQFSPKLVQTLIEGTEAKRGVVDEVGAAIPSGPGQYFALLRADADSLAACLKS
jgi:zinc transport system substrate-binding protein